MPTACLLVALCHRAGGGGRGWLDSNIFSYRPVNSLIPSRSLNLIPQVPSLRPSGLSACLPSFHAHRSLTPSIPPLLEDRPRLVTMYLSTTPTAVPLIPLVLTGSIVLLYRGVIIRRTLIAGPTKRSSPPKPSLSWCDEDLEYLYATCELDSTVCSASSPNQLFA